MDEDTTQANDTVVPEPTTGSDAMILINMENMIKTHQKNIDELAETVKKQQDMLKAIFENDLQFQKLEEEAKVGNKAKAAYKQQITKQPNVIELAAKQKDMRTDLKELKTALSDYLREYQRMSGSNVVEGYDGQLREIVYTAKLVRKSTKNQ